MQAKASDLEEVVSAEEIELLSVPVGGASSSGDVGAASEMAAAVMGSGSEEVDNGAGAHPSTASTSSAAGDRGPIPASLSVHSSTGHDPGDFWREQHR